MITLSWPFPRCGGRYIWLRNDAVLAAHVTGSKRQFQAEGRHSDSRDRKL